MTVPVVDSVRESVFNAVTEPLFSKSSGFYYKWPWQNLEWSVLVWRVTKPVLQSVLGKV